MFIHTTRAFIIQAAILTIRETSKNLRPTILMTEIVSIFLQMIIIAATHTAFARAVSIHEAHQAAELAAVNNRRFLWNFLMIYLK
jgi:hypothetical protein